MGGLEASDLDIGDTEELGKLHDGIWMVEVHILLVPLDGKVFLVAIEESLIHWLEVLHSALARDEVVSLLEDSGIVQLDSNRVPSLLALWINSCRNVKVSINS